jgi:hypothetical protein
MVEFARHFLIQGTTLVYGGDLRDKGYAELFAELAEHYRLQDQPENYPFLNYFSYPIHLNINKEQEGDFKSKRVKIERVPAEESLQIAKPEYVKPDTAEKKYIWAKCLTKMRREMTANINARISVGGRNFGFLGKYPGIVEETQMAIEAGKPTYLIGAFGGATLRMINSIAKKEALINSEAFFFTNTDYRNFKRHYNTHSLNDKIDFEELNQFFNRLSVSDLNNGLDEDENLRLFTTPHVPEAIFLVLKGLKYII